MNIAIVGATGAVGRKMIEVLGEYGIKYDHLGLFASERSRGQQVDVGHQKIEVQVLDDQSFTAEHYDIALFSAGGSISEHYAPLAAQAGTVVIDNSSTFRQVEDVALVVPEINPQSIDLARNRIIANPNCSTISALLALYPLQAAYGLAQIDYTTYQAVSGAGQKGIEDLLNGEKGIPPKKFPHPIYSNVIPHIDIFFDNGFTKEEMKMVWETHKILDLPELPISATCVRVPVLNAHAISVKVRLETIVSGDEIRETLRAGKNVIVLDDPQHDVYPTPLQASGQDKCLVGRIRQDLYDPYSYHLFCACDNLRKGAASNAVQIAAYLIDHHLV